MDFERTWQAALDRIDALADDEVLVTPADDRVFVVEDAGAGWLTIHFRDGDERVLPREQFRRLADRLDDGPMDLDALPPGVEPYVSVLSLAPDYVVEGGELRAAADGELAEPAAGADERGDDERGDDERAAEPERDATSPFVRSRWDVRRRPAQLHDDALLLAEELERSDAADPANLEEECLVDLYVLLSDVQRGANELRRDVGNELLEHVGPGGSVRGQYGAVSRAHREHRRPKDDEEVLDALDDAGVPREWVLGVDPDKLDVVVTTTSVEEADVFDVSETYYAQKTAVESDAKRSRLRGLKERLAGAEGGEAAELREEVEDLEDRIDEVLSAS